MLANNVPVAIWKNPQHIYILSPQHGDNLFQSPDPVVVRRRHVTMICRMVLPKADKMSLAVVVPMLTGSYRDELWQNPTLAESLSIMKTDF